MEILSRDRFEAAVAAVARPVDRGRLEMHFGSGDTTALREGLAAHRNEDGGYGHGMEPDFLLPESSPMATSVALQYMVAANAREDWPEVRAAIDYLVDRWDPGLPGWEPVPPGVDDHPRAPWWEYRPSEGFPANPGAEIVGYLCHFEELVPGPVLAASVTAAAEALDTVTSEVEAHEFLCWMRLARMAPAGLTRRIVERLRPAVYRIVSLDRDAWHAYVPGPLWVAPTPSSPFHDLVAAAVGDHLDHVVRTQRDDGLWAPTWTWGDDPAWPATAEVWTSPLTVQALESLDAYGRIEAV